MKKAKAAKQISLQIKALQNRINKLRIEKVKVHNNGAKSASLKFADRNKRNPTKCEEMFKKIAELKNINLEFQYPVYIYCGEKIDRFYIADFCDTKNKIIIEVDGKYHDDENQKRLDRSREYWLRKQGYGIYRITNEDVLAGKSTSFLYNIYKDRIKWKVGA